MAGEALLTSTRDSAELVAGLGVHDGLVHAPVTPFDSDRNVDLGALERVLRFHAAHAPGAVVLPMDIGEGPSLRPEERLAVVERAVDVLGGIPVIADVSQSGTILGANLAHDVERAGASAISLTTPYYWRPPEKEVIEHFRQVADATSLPVFLHNSPKTHSQGASVSHRMLEQLLASSPNIVGVLDGSRNWTHFTTLRRITWEADPSFVVLTDAEYLSSSMVLGGNGGISQLSGIAPRLVAELYRICRSKDYHGARELQHKAGRLWLVLNQGSLPANVKAAMSIMGRDVGIPRKPNLPLRPEALDKLRAELIDLEILGTEPEGWDV